MNCGQALIQARLILEKSNIDESALEGEILLRHVLGIDRAALFSRLDEEIPDDRLKTLLDLVERRRRGEPSAYITGHREFYGLDFKIDHRVLIPRQETELLVEKAIEVCRRWSYTSIADIGTGSGCIAVSLAKHLPGVSIFAVDISPGAMKVAEQNCRLHGVQDKVVLLQGNLIEPLLAPVGIIVANLPYVKTTDMTLKFEPELALDGGAEGLDKVIALCRNVRDKLKPHGTLLLEIGQGQANTVKDILHNTFLDGVITVEKDLAGIERVVSIRLTS